MKHCVAALAAILLVSGTMGYAQFEKSKYEPSAVDTLIDRVHSDLDHAYGSFHFSNGDRDRLNKAEKQLRDFAKQWRANHFDKGELDDAISSVQHVLDNNRLPQDSREALSDDVGQLRQMREAYDRHEIGGTK